MTTPYREIPSHDDVHRLHRRIRAMERRWKMVTSPTAWVRAWARAIGIDVFGATMISIVVTAIVLAAWGIAHNSNASDRCTVSCARGHLDYSGTRDGNECVCLDRKGTRSVTRAGR